MYIKKEQRWDVKASLELGRMVDATQLMGLGWGGVGCDVKASLELDRMVYATQLVGWGWGGVGWDVKFLHIERKITSVVHSHPPSHYIRKHASG